MTLYTCFRCNHQTNNKNDMRKHLYNRKSACPAASIETDIELTDEIKEYILKNRVYHVPKEKKTTKRKNTNKKISKKNEDINNTENIHNTNNTNNTENTNNTMNNEIIIIKEDDKPNETFISPIPTIDDRLLTLMREEMNTEEQQQFINSFKIYLKYGNDDKQFIISLDDIWQWMGYYEKSKAKRLLISKFEENKDYIIHSPVRANGLIGSEKEVIMLNVSTFKKFCMKASTKRADDICNYYIKMENIMHQYTYEQMNTLQKRLDTVIVYDDELFWNENQIKDFDNKNVNYLGFIGIHDNVRLHKFGKSDQILTREFNHHRRMFKDFKMVFVIECDNMTNVEREFKKRLKSIGLLRTANVGGSNQTELFTITDKYTIKVIIEMLRNLVEEMPLPSVKKIKEENNNLLNEIQLLKEDNNNLLDKIQLLEEENQILLNDSNTDEMQLLKEENQKLKLKVDKFNKIYAEINNL